MIMCRHNLNCFLTTSLIYITLPGQNATKALMRGRDRSAEGYLPPDLSTDAKAVVSLSLFSPSPGQEIGRRAFGPRKTRP